MPELGQTISLLLRILTILCYSSILPARVPVQETTRISYQQKSFPLYPVTLDTRPDIPSPLITPGGLEIVTGFRRMDSTYTLIPVTVENGAPLNYKLNQRGRGRQLDVNAEDFPTLRRTGLHSEKELSQTRTITGRSVEEITEDGRPGRSSYAGFMSQDEDIIAVLKGDNRLVEKLGLTHPQLAKPMFHLWNIIQNHDAQMRLLDKPLQGIDWFYYRGRKIHLLDAGSGHGWQESIFQDGILGMWQFEIKTELSLAENAFLHTHYAHLDAEQMSELTQKLTYIHTGEMVPFYIMRYGFYEGHTSYRADPIAIAFIFGILNLDEIEKIFRGMLYETLTNHFTPHNSGR